MAKAIVVTETGGPEVLRIVDVPVGKPGPGEVRVRQGAIGLNFIDVYYRNGTYKAPSLPFTPGMEAAGVIVAIGSDVKEFTVGDRVAYASPPVGAYTELRLMAAERLVPLPDMIDDKTAAAMMLKGMTAQYLLRRTYHVKAGDTILFHAAAGGVGLIACQWARQLGATVIGTVGNDEKAALAAAHGCHYPIVYTKENFVERVRAITEGRGVSAVYDSIGKDTFLASLDCLAPRGIMVSFGQSSGTIPPFDVTLLNIKGSLFLTRPSLFAYTADRVELMATAQELIRMVVQGAVKVVVNQTYPLAEACDAHRALQAGETTGSTVLLP